MRTSNSREATTTAPIDDAEGQHLQKQYQRESAWINALRIIGRVLDLLSSYTLTSPVHPIPFLTLPRTLLTYISSGTIAMMGLNLAKYYQTLHDHNGNQLLWSDSTFSWPNDLATASAVITFIAAAVVLIAYCWGKEVAARLDNNRALLAKVLLVANICINGAAAIAMYKTRGNPNSLSGQTCGAPPQKGPSFPQINFDKFCLMQVYPPQMFYF